MAWLAVKFEVSVQQRRAVPRAAESLTVAMRPDDKAASIVLHFEGEPALPDDEPDVAMAGIGVAQDIVQHFRQGC